MIAVALGLQVALFLLVAALFLAWRGASLFHPLALYLAFHGLVFVLRPLLVHLGGFDSQWLFMGFRPTPAQVVETLAVASFALVVFAAASLWTGRVPAHVSRPAPAPLAFTPAERQAFHLVLLALLPLALFAAWRDLEVFGLIGDPAFGGPGDMRRDPTTGHTVFVGTSAYIVKAHNLLVPLTALFVAVHRFQWWAYLPFLAFLGYRLYLSSRWGVIVACGILLLLHLTRARRRWPALAALLLALPLAAAFHAVGQDRAAFRALAGLSTPGVAMLERAPPQAAPGWIQGLDGPDFANFDYLAYIVAKVPAESGTHTYFTQYLALFTQPIPRALWPDKPIGPPVRLVDLNRHGRFYGRTWSLPGDGWMSLGWIGVGVTLAAAGALLGRAYAAVAARPQATLAVVAWCAFLPVAILWFRGGVITSVARLGMWMLLPVILWWVTARLLTWLERRRRPHGPQRAGEAAW
jgi:hypothetical protein